MSRKVPKEQYEKTISYRLKSWLEGSRDLYLGNLEMRPQSPRQEDEGTRRRHQEDKKRVRARVYDTEHNREMLLFKKIYRIFSLLFCVFLVSMLLIGVADLPPFGEADKPVNNEVPQRYIEKGLQDAEKAGKQRKERRREKAALRRRIRLSAV